MQSDYLYSALFFEHYNRILLCDWVLDHCSVSPFEGVYVTMHSYFTWLGLTNLGINVPLCNSVVPSEQIVLRMCL